MVDPISDISLVCTNCHLAFHSKADEKPYDIDELEGKIEFIKKQ